MNIRSTVDGAAALNMAIDALVRRSTIGDGSGSRWCLGSHPDHRSSISQRISSGNDHGESGDGGGDGKARSISTSSLEGSDIGVSALMDILAVMRYARCGGGVATDSSVSNGLVSSADGACSTAGK
ncbi:hypothetical protein Tco_0944327 [Tanacetum coccineum]